MCADRIEPKPLTRYPWFPWSWLIVLGVVVLQSLNYHCRFFPTTASGYFARGRADYSSENYEDAIENLSKSIDGNANDPESHIWRGEAYARLHEFDEAKSDLLQAVELAPDYAKSHAALADYFATVWDRESAIKEFTAAIDQDPKYGRCYLGRGQLYLDAGRWNDALVDLRKASVLLDEDEQATAHALVWLARVRGGEAAEATAELVETARSERVTKRWFRAAADFLEGDMTEPDFFETMGTAKGEDGVQLRAEGYFLAGEKRLASGDRAGGLALLREVLRSGVEESYAYNRARVELQKSFVGLEPMRLDDGSLLIVSLIPGGLADAAGIKPGSKLEAIDEEPASADTFVELLAKLNPGLTVKLEILDADGSEREVPLQIPLTLETSAPTK